MSDRQDLAAVRVSDTTTFVEVSIMIYYTAEFAAEFESQVSFDGFIEEASVSSVWYFTSFLNND